MSLAAAGFSHGLQIASVLGVISGGVLADRLVRRRPAGRMMTQVIRLLAGVPFISSRMDAIEPILVLALALATSKDCPCEHLGVAATSCRRRCATASA
ncbi:MAG: hypothetical protein Udaeo2_22840 [Candidatus Udaeobacter sp.]|nr:MAG: hypothetical protein Udaeo2_22840 [Candidatus Udaeobacter sp.]